MKYHRHVHWNDQYLNAGMTFVNKLWPQPFGATENYTEIRVANRSTFRFPSKMGHDVNDFRGRCKFITFRGVYVINFNISTDLLLSSC